MPINATDPYDDGNIFARILRGEVPCKRVHETDHALAFHDINPACAVHFLIIPKTHLVNLYDADMSQAPLLGKMFGMAGRLGRQMLAAAEADLEMQRAGVAEQPLGGDRPFRRHRDSRQQIVHQRLLPGAQGFPLGTAVKPVERGRIVGVKEDFQNFLQADFSSVEGDAHYFSMAGVAAAHLFVAGVGHVPVGVAAFRAGDTAHAVEHRFGASEAAAAQSDGLQGHAQSSLT